jgi:hypothetical protein
MKHLLVLLLTVTSGAAFAQTTVTVDPSPSPAEPSMKEDVPPGGCMPIGLTASGEIVFPIQCKEERQRGQAVEQKPAAVEERPGVSLPAWANSDAFVKPRGRAMSPDDGYSCQHYRTYDPASRTYMGYDGRRHSCP